MAGPTPPRKKHNARGLWGPGRHVTKRLRIHPCGSWRPPPNLAAGIQSLSFNRSHWHPAASLRSDHPPEPGTGRRRCSVENPLRRLRRSSFTVLPRAEDETSGSRIFCSVLLCACNNHRMGGRLAA